MFGLFCALFLQWLLIRFAHVKAQLLGDEIMIYACSNKRIIEKFLEESEERVCTTSGTLEIGTPLV